MPTAPSSTDRCVGTLTAAFDGYPLSRWLLGNGTDTQARLKGLFSTLLSLPEAVKFHIDTDSGGDAVALWLASEDLPFFGAAHCSTALQSFRHELGHQVARRLLKFQAASDRHHVGRAFDYLFLLAVRPAIQGRGFGSQLLRGGLERRGSLGRPVILETATRSNLSFYEKRGFTVSDQYYISPGSPLTWVMEKVRVRSASDQTDR